jgi:hypothetical protein
VLCFCFYVASSLWIVSCLIVLFWLPLHVASLSGLSLFDCPSVFSNVYCNELIVQYFLTRYDLLIAIFYRIVLFPLLANLV